MMGNDDVPIGLAMHKNDNMAKGNSMGEMTIESESEQGAKVCPNCASSLGRQQRRLDEPFVLKQRDETRKSPPNQKSPPKRRSPPKRSISSSFLCCVPMLAIDEAPQDGDYNNEDPTMSSILDESKAPAIQLQAEAHQQELEQNEQAADGGVPFCVNCQAHVISRQLEMDRLLAYHGGDKEVLSMLFRQGRILLATTTSTDNDDDVRDEKESSIVLSSVPNLSEKSDLSVLDNNKQEEHREFRGGETSTYSSNSNNNNNKSGPSLVDSESDDEKDDDDERHDPERNFAHNNHVDDTTDNLFSSEEDNGDVSSLEEDHESNHDDNHDHKSLVQAPTDELTGFSTTKTDINNASGKNSPSMQYNARREIAAKVLGDKMMEGFILTQEQCPTCIMPLMRQSESVDHELECVVCPILEANLKTAATGGKTKKVEIKKKKVSKAPPVEVQILCSNLDEALDAEDPSGISPSSAITESTAATHHLQGADFETKRNMVSREIGRRMLAGWQLLDMACPFCVMPLMTAIPNGAKQCVLCGDIAVKQGELKSLVTNRSSLEEEEEQSARLEEQRFASIRSRSRQPSPARTFVMPSPRRRVSPTSDISKSREPTGSFFPPHMARRTSIGSTRSSSSSSSPGWTVLHDSAPCDECNGILMCPPGGAKAKRGGGCVNLKCLRCIPGAQEFYRSRSHQDGHSPPNTMDRLSINSSSRHSNNTSPSVSSFSRSPRRTSRLMTTTPSSRPPGAQASSFASSYSPRHSSVRRTPKKVGDEIQTRASPSKTFGTNRTQMNNNAETPPMAQPQPGNDDHDTTRFRDHFRQQREVVDLVERLSSAAALMQNN